MRVATWNIQHGRRPDGIVDVALVGSTAAGLGVEMLALQEVDVRAHRSRRTDEAAAVARACGLHHVFAPARRIGLFGRYGNVLLARETPSDVSVAALPGRGEPRAVLVARVGGVTVAVTHLSTRRDDSGPQLELVVERLLARPGPHLLLGDLNRRDGEVDALVDRGFTVAGGPPTYPADGPRLRIDHVAVRGLVVGAVEAPTVPVSDHRPLVVEVCLP